MVVLGGLTMFADSKAPKTKRRGRPAVLTDELKYWIATARDRGIDYATIAAAINVSSTTVWKFATRGELATDAKSQALAPCFRSATAFKAGQHKQFMAH